MRKRDVLNSPRRPSEYRRQISGRSPLDITFKGRPYRYEVDTPKEVTAPTKTTGSRRGPRLKRLLTLLYDELRKDRSLS